MEMKKVEDLHKRGRHVTAVKGFSEVCVEEIRGRYAIPSSISHLVHYSTIDALFSMLGIGIRNGKPVLLSKQGNIDGNSQEPRSEFLRLYDTFYSNDPNEGYFFVNSVEEDNEFRERYRAIWDLFKRRSASPAYMTSLVCVESLDEVDDLVFWRTYGREGSGCALAIPIDRFKDERALYQVQYGETEVVSCLGVLEEILDAYIAINGAKQMQELESFAELPGVLATGLSPMVYLHKSDDYKYEKEARIVIPYSDISDGLYLDTASTNSSPSSLRHFAQLDTLQMKNMLVSESLIKLGPTVEAPSNIQFVLQRVLEKLGFYGPDVETSSISYRR